MGRVDDTEILKILTRIGKLSQRPPNPGLAYRNLEMIEALVESLTKQITGEVTEKRKPPRRVIIRKQTG